MDEMSAWISVKDQLPDFGVPVLVAWDKCLWREDGTGYVAQEMHARTDTSDGWLWYETVTDNLDEWDADELPTHWMPSPRPPA